jgi:hypothetical protein
MNSTRNLMNVSEFRPVEGDFNSSEENENNYERERRQQNEIYSVPNAEITDKDDVQRRQGLLKTFHGKPITPYLKALFNNQKDSFDEEAFANNLRNKEFLELIQNKNDEEEFEFDNWAMDGFYLNKILNFDCKIFFVEDGKFINNLKHAYNIKRTFSSNDVSTKWSELFINSFLENSIDPSRYSPRYELFHFCFCSGEYNYEKKGSKCLKCGEKVAEANSFCMFNMLDMFSIWLSDPELFSDATKKYSEQTQNQKDGLLFDFFDGKIAELLIQAGASKLANIVLFGFLFIDEVDCLENAKQKICAVILCILNFDPKKRTLEKYLIPIAFYQVRHSHHNSIFAPLIAQLQKLFFKKNIITIYFYYVENGILKANKFTGTLKLIIVAFARDKASAKLWLDIKGHSGYCSCISCLRIGRIATTNNTTVCYPESGIDEKAARRTFEWNKECDKHKEFFHLENFGGHHSLAVVTKLEQFDCWAISTHCPMHCIAEGVEQTEYFRIPINYREIIENLSSKVKFTKETNAGISNLKHLSSFGASYWLTLLLFSLVPLMYEAKVQTKITFIKFSILAKYYETLNSKTTPIKRTCLEELHKSIMIYVKSSENPTPKIHSLSHMSEDVSNLGLFWNYNSFSTESLLKIFKKVTVESKINLSNACRNYFEQASVINLFSHFSIEILQAFKVSKENIKLCKKYILSKIIIATRDESKSVSFFFDGNEITIKSLQRTYKEINGTKIMITTNSYSEGKKTNNQFVVMEDRNEIFYAKIIAIESTFKDVYFQRAIIETPEEFKRLSLGRTEIATFENDIETLPWKSLSEKLVGFELNNKFYLTKTK